MTEFFWGSELNKKMTKNLRIGNFSLLSTRNFPRENWMQTVNKWHVCWHCRQRDIGRVYAYTNWQKCQRLCQCCTIQDIVALWLLTFYKSSPEEFSLFDSLLGVNALRLNDKRANTVTQLTTLTRCAVCKVNAKSRASQNKNHKIYISLLHRRFQHAQFVGESLSIRIGTLLQQIYSAVSQVHFSHIRLFFHIFHFREYKFVLYHSCTLLFRFVCVAFVYFDFTCSSISKEHSNT